MFVFVWLVKPTWKQLGILTVLFSLYTLFTRYMLSGMPEVICFGMLILFYGLAFSYLNKETKGKLTAMFIVSVLLTDQALSGRGIFYAAFLYGLDHDVFHRRHWCRLPEFLRNAALEGPGILQTLCVRYEERPGFRSLF